MNYISIFQTIKDSIGQCMNLGSLSDGATQDDLDMVDELFETYNPNNIPMLKTMLPLIGLNKDLMAQLKAGVRNRESFEEAVVDLRRLVNSDKFMNRVFDNTNKYINKLDTIMNQETNYDFANELIKNLIPEQKNEDVKEHNEESHDVYQNALNEMMDKLRAKRLDEKQEVRNVETDIDETDNDSIVFESESDYDDYDHKIALMRFEKNRINIEHDPDNVVALIFGDMITLNPGDYTIEVRSPDFDDTTDLVLLADGYEFEMNKETIHNTVAFTYGTKVTDHFVFSIKKLNGKELDDIEIGVIEIVKHERIDAVDSD